MDERPEPDRRPAPVARLFWTLEAVLWAVPGAVAAWFVGRGLRSLDGAWATLGEVLPWLAIGVALTGLTVVPALRARRWRWRLADEELDLRHGILTEVRTIIPVSRIQHVDLRRNPIAQLLGVCTLVVHTAAGATEIPALAVAEASQARDRLAGLLHAPDDL